MILQHKYSLYNLFADHCCILYILIQLSQMSHQAKGEAGKAGSRLGRADSKEGGGLSDRGTASLPDFDRVGLAEEGTELWAGIEEMDVTFPRSSGEKTVLTSHTS